MKIFRDDLRHKAPAEELFSPLLSTSLELANHIRNARNLRMPGVALRATFLPSDLAIDRENGRGYLAKIVYPLGTDRQPPLSSCGKNDEGECGGPITWL